MVNFKKDLNNLGKRAMMIFQLIRENDNTEKVMELVKDKKYSDILMDESYFENVEEREKKIKKGDCRIEQTMVEKYRRVAEEYYIQWEEVLIYYRRTIAFLEAVGTKYLEFNSVEEMLNSFTLHF